MKLETRNVFIDTQSFVSHGLNFENSALKTFEALCEKSCLFHITTTVVKREIESKITESIHEALSALKKFRRKARVLSSVKNDAIQALFLDVEDNQILKESIGVFEAFLHSTKVDVLTLSEIDPEYVLNSYFGRQPPFGDGKKKSEFPDAFSMSALEKYSKEKNEKIYVVSDDKDLKDFCALHKRLIAVNSLDKLLDIYNSHESTLSELVKQFITENISLLKERIKEVLAYSDAVDEAAGEDSEVEDFSVQVIESYEPTVISIDEKHAVATFDFDADIEVTVTGPDRNGGYYDREEGRVFPFGDTRRHYTDTRTFTAEIKLIYGYSDGKLKNCMITGVTLAGSYRKTMARARGTLGFSSP